MLKKPYLIILKNPTKIPDHHQNQVICFLLYRPHSLTFLSRSGQYFSICFANKPTLPKYYLLGRDFSGQVGCSTTRPSHVCGIGFEASSKTHLECTGDTSVCMKQAAYKLQY